MLENSKLRVKQDTKSSGEFVLEAGNMWHGKLGIKSAIINGEVKILVYPVKDGNAMREKVLASLEESCRYYS